MAAPAPAVPDSYDHAVPVRDGGAVALHPAPGASAPASIAAASVRPPAPRTLEFTLHYGASLNELLTSKGWLQPFDAARQLCLPVSHFVGSPLLHVVTAVGNDGFVFSTTEVLRLVPIGRWAVDGNPYPTDWIHSEDARAAAVAHHGSEAALVAALSAAAEKEQKAQRTREKAAETRKRKADAREDSLNAALTVAQASPDDIRGNSYRKRAAQKMVSNYVSVGKGAIHTVVAYCAATKYLHKKTTFVENCNLFGVKGGGAMDAVDNRLVAYALVPYGNAWPAVWPWLTWSQETHLLVSSQPFKAAVRAWLMVANRLKVPQLVAVEVVRAMLQDKNCRRKRFRVKEKEPPRWWPLRLKQAS